jgi:hypothetical protein
MFYLFAKHKVTDFDKWHKIFSSHVQAQRDAGLHLLHLLRGTTDPNMVVMLFKADDPGKAKAFTETPDANKAGQESGVIGKAEILILSD